MHVEPKSDYSNADKGAFVMLDKIECMHGAKKAKRKESERELSKSTLTDRQDSEG